MVLFLEVPLSVFPEKAAHPMSSQTYTLTAFQLAESFPIKLVRARWGGHLLSAGSQELFYGPAQGTPEALEGGFTFILQYGVVVYAGLDEAEMTSRNQILAAMGVNLLSEPLRETFRLEAGYAGLDFGFNGVRMPTATPEALRIVMLHVGQSVALEYYENLAETLLDAPRAYIAALEKFGKLKAPRKAVLRTIGRTLSVRNRIIDTLYVLDAPDAAWDDEFLDKLDKGMKKSFDTVTRFHALDDQLVIVKENLEIIVELLQARESAVLEWIIIILILVEVIHIFV
jgi:uncharacterized Rmd1/YagE family protein